ncbi:hypothetical protein BDZ89DRAFT_315790 [Hymenopellis radicata]|nr:hypothetical protein BDZ89DRAFT_315790 [Hymenopellis radicata]
MTSPNTSWASYRSASSTPSPRSSRASSIDNLKAPDGSGAMEVFQSIYNGRKSWKTLRGGEMVWPAELEAALIEGLEKYQPDDSRETRLLGRFPMRNRFISEYIYRKTGRRRTAKQVGSRLQQLRETCTGKRLMDLLSPCRRQVPAPLTSSAYDSTSTIHCDSASSNGSGSVPITPTDEVAPYSFSGGKRSTARQTFCIDILPQDDRASTSGCNGQSRFPSGLDVNSSASAFSEGVTRLSEHPRHIRTIDPTLTFVSHSRVTADCQFAVYSEGHLVFKESTVLSPYEIESKDVPPGTDGCLLYRTSLVPNYWKTISESNDPTKYTIFQEIIQAGQQCVYAAKYTFAYPPQYGPPTFAPAPAVLPDSHFDFSYEDLQNCFGTDTPPQEYPKSGQAYSYGNFASNAWFPVPRGSDTRTLQHGPVQGFDIESSSGSISPMSATFPGDFAEPMNGQTYQGNFDMM